ncbi:MAG: DUF547 domain-containing protein [Myxococcota bacterium]
MIRVATALFVLASLWTPLPAAAFDEALYARLLSAHTREVDDLARVRVDYAAIAVSDDWRRLVASLSGSDPTTLRTRDERLAFWVNAYNVLAIDVVARNWPVESIRDVGSLFSPVWKRQAGRIGGKPYTLDQIEHDIVRPMGDARAHAAVVCASTSCPALRREPFTADRLDAQLDDAMRRWMADRGKGLRVDRSSGTVWLSKIFDWFEEDFAPSPLAFAARFASDADRRAIEQLGDGADVEYFDYDWAVNALR